MSSRCPTSFSFSSLNGTDMLDIHLKWLFRGSKAETTSVLQSLQRFGGLFDSMACCLFSRFSYRFPRVSYGFLSFSYCFHMVFNGFHMVFIWF